MEPVKEANTGACERTLNTLAHLAPLAGFLIPLGSILLPLGVLLLGRKNASVRTHAKESLNAQISYVAYGFVPLLLLLAGQKTGSKLLFALTILLGLILSGLILWNMVAAVRAALRAEKPVYRLIFRLIR